MVARRNHVRKRQVLWAVLMPGQNPEGRKADSATVEILDVSDQRIVKARNQVRWLIYLAVSSCLPMMQTGLIN